MNEHNVIKRTTKKAQKQSEDTAQSECNGLLSELIPLMPIGVDAYIIKDKNNRPDYFQHVEKYYHFPCSICEHVKHPLGLCVACCHYVL